MDVKTLILKKLKEEQEVRASDIARETGFSRVYVHRILKSLVDDGALMLIGKANQAKYVAADKGNRVTESQLRVRRICTTRASPSTGCSRISSEPPGISSAFAKMSPRLSTTPLRRC